MTNKFVSAFVSQKSYIINLDNKFSLNLSGGIIQLEQIVILILIDIFTRQTVYGEWGFQINFVFWFISDARHAPSHRRTSRSSYILEIIFW